jgi:hypothetical protein
VKEMAARLEVIPQTVKNWRAAGVLTAYPYNSKNQCLYEPPGADRPRKHSHKGLSRNGIRPTYTPTRSRGAV